MSSSPPYPVQTSAGKMASYYLPGIPGQSENGHIRYDIWILIPVIFLVGIGIVMVYSASSALALKEYGTDSYFLKKQSLFALVSLGGLVAGRFFPLKWLRGLAYPILILSLGMLIAVLVPGLGVRAGGATRWLRFGDLTFQPAEFARFAMVLYLAHSMTKKGEKLKIFSVGMVPHLIVLGFFTLLIMLQPDFGSVMILFFITWLMLFIGGVRFAHLVNCFLVLLPVIFLFMTRKAYRMRRLVSFLDPWKYQQDEGYQIIHSMLAFGTGGLWGVGIGGGYQKLFYLPEPHTDFIFSVVGEELGLVGVLIILLCYSFTLWAGIKIAIGCEGMFETLLAAGLTFSLGLQVCINIGVAMALLPTKGLTLPFLSYGGTSLLMNMGCIGILMNIGAHHHYEPTA